MSYALTLDSQDLAQIRKVGRTTSWSAFLLDLGVKKLDRNTTEWQTLVPATKASEFAEIVMVESNNGRKIPRAERSLAEKINMFLYSLT